MGGSVALGAIGADIFSCRKESGRDGGAFLTQKAGRVARPFVSQCRVVMPAPPINHAIAAAPCCSQSAQKSATSFSASRFLEPFGRPNGLPD
jgi:hypothetical protein